MTWTINKPSLPGFYWIVQRGPYPGRTIVARMSDGSLFTVGNREPLSEATVMFWSLDPLAVPDMPFELTESEP